MRVVPIGVEPLLRSRDLAVGISGLRPVCGVIGREMAQVPVGLAAQGYFARLTISALNACNWVLENRPQISMPAASLIPVILTRLSTRVKRIRTPCPVFGSVVWNTPIIVSYFALPIKEQIYKIVFLFPHRCQVFRVCRGEADLDG